MPMPLPNSKSKEEPVDNPIPPDEETQNDSPTGGDDTTPEIPFWAGEQCYEDFGDEDEN